MLYFATMRPKDIILLILILLLTYPIYGYSAQAPCKGSETLTPIPDIRLKKIVDGLDKPVHLTGAGDGSGRLFIVEQKGVIRIYKKGKLLREPFLDIRERVESGGEKGLLSVAFHPAFPEKRLFYVNYTSSTGWLFKGLHTVISEFRISKDNPDRADRESERIILTIPQPFPNHNGGQIAFGPDGYLYIGMGDGGSGYDPYGNGQNSGTLPGAILRIDVDKRQDSLPYFIPQDNPFINVASARPEIWAYGLRNPWRFSFDPRTGELYAGDVGQRTREEIDIIKKGRNYGWNIMEGSICTPAVHPDCDKTGLELPIIDYGRDEGISVIGGFVYRGSEIPELCGVYIYGDFGSGRIWGLRYKNGKVISHRLLLKTPYHISSFGIDDNYELYIVDYGGRIFKVVRG